MPIRHTAEQPICEPPPGGDRDRRELGAARDVADRIDALDVRVLVIVDAMKPTVVELHAGGIKTEIARVRVAADRPEHRVESVEPAAIGREQAQAVCALHFARDGPGHDRDARRLHLGRETQRQHGSKCRSTPSKRTNTVTSLPSARSTPPSSTAT